MVLSIELASRANYYIRHGESYSPLGVMQKASTELYIPRTTEVPQHLDNLALHPYFGFFFPHPLTATGMGFAWQTSPVAVENRRDAFRILVLGGSVAVQLTQPVDGVHSYLQRAVSKQFELARIDLEVMEFSAALPGFKQPQQLNAFSYLLTQGATFDLVVNLDGFNEMTLALLEGRHKKLNLSYPRGWDVMLGRGITSSRFHDMADIMLLRREQSALEEFGENSVLAYSALIGLYLEFRVAQFEERARELVGRIEREHREGQSTIEELGPPMSLPSTQAEYQYLAGLWGRSSELIDQLSTANDIEYLHVFQPNQYVPGGKPLSELERAEFYMPDIGFGFWYRNTYSDFLQEMESLREKGIWFIDASMLFEREEQTVYIDHCCHFNERGLTAIADYIAREVVASSKRLREKAGR